MGHSRVALAGGEPTQVKVKTAFLSWAVLLLSGLARPALAHPQSVTLGEVHVRGDHLEVALSVSTHDLVAALARRGADFFGPRGEAEVAAYVRSAFAVEGAAGPAQPLGPVALEWVGQEAGPAGVWLYFQVPLRRLEGATLSHRLFFEGAPSQLNTLTVHRGAQTWTLVFSPEHPTLPLLSPSGNMPEPPPAARP